MVVFVDLTIKASQRHPIAIFPFKSAGSKRIGDGRNLVFPGVFPGREEVSLMIAAHWPAKSEGRLIQFVAGQLIAARRCSGSEAPQIGRGRRGTKISDHAAVVLISATLRDNIYGATRAASIFGRERIGENIHLVESLDRQVREDGLPSPPIK